MTTDEQIDEMLVELDQYNRRETLTPQEVMALFPELQEAKAAIKKLLLEARIKTLQEPLDWGRGKTIVDTADGWEDFYRKHMLHFQKRLDQLTKEANSL